MKTNKEEELSTLEIDLELFSKNELITLIIACNKEDITFSSFVNKCLKTALFDAEKLLEIQSQNPTSKESF